MMQGGYPAIRMRRNRFDSWTRRLVAENQLSTSDLIWPIFVREGTGVREPVPSMPGVDRLSIDLAVAAAEQAASLGIPALALFPVTPKEAKDEDGTESANPENLMCRATRAIKKAVPEIGLVGDVALDPYTSHGHDGVIRDGYVANDESVAILCRQAVVQAEAGIDASGEVGDSEPLVAVQDALVTFPADRIVIVGHPDGHRDYREDGDLAAEVRERFGVPVDFGTVNG